MVDLSGRIGRVVRKIAGVCTWCGTMVEKPRRTWCSQDCVSAFWATQPGHQRSLVLARDHGVCAACKLDTIKLEQLADRLRGFLCRWHRFSPWMRDSVRRTWEKLGREPPASGRYDLWDLEHVVAITDGGDPHDPANWQTLCIWCHKAKTKREHGERARRRREAASGQHHLALE